MDMRFNTTKGWRKKLEPRVYVWNLKQETTCGIQNMVRDKVEEAE